MSNMAFLLLCLVSCCHLRQVVSYSQGAPSSACKSLTPEHGVDPQTSEAPYSIDTSATSVNGTQPIEVVLKGEDGKNFKGFILQARNANTQELLGAFSFQTEGGLPSPIKNMECGTGHDAALTHTNNKPKEELTVTWESSGYYDGDVVFTGTFVESKERFWVGVTSQEVRVTKSKDLSTSMPSSSSVAPNTFPTTPHSGATGLLLPNPGLHFLISSIIIWIFNNQINIHFC